LGSRTHVCHGCGVAGRRLAKEHPARRYLASNRDMVAHAAWWRRHGEPLVYRRSSTGAYAPGMARQAQPHKRERHGPGECRADRHLLRPLLHRFGCDTPLDERHSHRRGLLSAALARSAHLAGTTDGSSETEKLVAVSLAGELTQEKAMLGRIGDDHRVARKLRTG
jgi:hypothetical protein